MPRPKKDTGTEPKKRSRTGCWPCKARKVKCGEEKPMCANCAKSGETCDYSIRLNWGGRSRKDKDGTPSEAGSFTFVTTPTSSATPRSVHGGGHEHVFSAQHIATAPSRPPSSHPVDLPTPEPTPGIDLISNDLRYRLGHGQQLLSQHRENEPALYGSPAFPSGYGSVHDSPSTDHTTPTSAPLMDDFRWSPQHRTKRARLGSPTETNPSPVFAIPQYPNPLEHSPAAAHLTPHSMSGFANTPATPGSSVTSGSPYPIHPTALGGHDPPDLRRLSVKSLLSDPAEEFERPRPARTESHMHRTYGYDHGLADLDLPKNDDHHVILPRSPDLRRASIAVSEISSSSNEIDPKQIAFEPGGYYAEPVPIKILRAWEPLPDELLHNQMNLLYFHHFINHTGRILVPHDCPENPFRNVLPRMAVRNTHLLHLLLAFSASHRAKLLDHAEPANRIAMWMSDVVPALRQALNEPSSPGTTDPTDPSSLAPLATAIMLAALEILTPNTENVQIHWQQHLKVAQEMIVAKGGLDHLAQKADGVRDKAIFFLSRWFAYLDVLGSLSNRFQQPLSGAYLEDGGGRWLVNRDNEEVYQIDCFFGFSGRCISLLAQVAELSALCDSQRIDPVTNQVKPGWRPEERVRQQAEELQTRLQASASNVFQGCMHADSSDVRRSQQRRDADAEIYATNEAYHWAGLLHLSRRVLGLPSGALEVQEYVALVIRSLQRVRRGSSAESCLLFPMFTAGCEAQRPDHRELIMDRLRAVEGWGMHQAGRARQIMQLAWDTGKPWETLADGDFFG